MARNPLSRSGGEPLPVGAAKADAWTIDPFDLKFLRALLASRAGLALWTEKRYLAEIRLTVLAEDLGLGGPEALIAMLRQTRDPELEEAVVEAMTTQETYFFRDARPFQLLEHTLLPALLRKRASTRRLRIWSCATATGQEAYSIAMALARQKDQLAGWSIDILGTDLSRTAIARARVGQYSHFEVQRGLPVSELITHFTQVGGRWAISDAMRNAVRFEVVNLAHHVAQGPFDIVFCRNVLIYFETAVKSSVLDRVAATLAPDGSLLLGSSETVLGVSDRLIPCPENRGLYVHARDQAPARRAIATA